MSKLLGKRALVTAGAQGIGLAISQQLLAAGCDLYVHYRTSAKAAGELAKEAKAAGRRYASSAADLTEAEECAKLVRDAAAFLGGIDILVNNAGSLVARKSLAEADDEYWAEVMSLNLGSTRRVTKAALPHLLAAGKAGGASVINMASLAARNGGGLSQVAYATAKNAIIGFTRSMSKELGPHGVRVNVLCPGLILGSAFHEIHTPKEMQKSIIAGIPLGRAGTLDDVARVTVFLASEYDGFLNGVALDINGGSLFS